MFHNFVLGEGSEDCIIVFAVGKGRFRCIFLVNNYVKLISNFPEGRILTPSLPLLLKINNIELTMRWGRGGGGGPLSSSRSVNEQGRSHTEIQMFQWIIL